MLGLVRLVWVIFFTRIKRNYKLKKSSQFSRKLPVLIYGSETMIQRGERSRSTDGQFQRFPGYQENG